MRRVISLWLPDWPVDLLRRRMQATRTDDGRADGEGKPADGAIPIILWSARGGAQTVAACCPRCRQRGIVVGMRMAHARALLTASEAQRCVLERWRPRRTTLALHRLATWALRYAPSVAVDETATDDFPGAGLLIDLAGCGRLHGETPDDAMRLLRRIGSDLARRGIAVRAAAAPTIGAAWALARYAPSAPTVVTETGLVAALDDLPIAALRLDPEIAAALRDVEIVRIGDLRILPRDAVARRHGGGTLRRLDQAFGDDSGITRETIVSVRETPDHRVRQAFDGPVRDVEGIALATRATIDRLCALLESASCGVRRLALTLEPAGAQPWRIVVDLSRPTRRPVHLWALLRPHLERIDRSARGGGFGIDAIALEALRTGPVAAMQRTQWPDPAADPAGSAHGIHDRSAGELLDALLGRLGAERVLRPTMQEAHLPERQMALGSVLEAIPAADVAAPRAEPPASAPPLLLRHPEAAAAGPCPHSEAPPAWIAWRGERLAIAVASGPQRLLGPWWERQEAAARDYWRLRDERGRWLWAYRDLRDGCWFVHGVWN